MTTILLINAALGAVALSVIVSVVAWAIKTQHRDLPAVVAAGATRRQAAPRRRAAARRRLAQPLA